MVILSRDRRSFRNETVKELGKMMRIRVLHKNFPHKTNAQRRGIRSLTTKEEVEFFCHASLNHSNPYDPQNIESFHPISNCNCKEEIQLLVGKIVIPLYCLRKFNQHSKSSRIAVGIVTLANGEVSPCNNEYRRLLNALPAITTVEAKLSCPARV